MPGLQGLTWPGVTARPVVIHAAHKLGEAAGAGAVRAPRAIVF